MSQFNVISHVASICDVNILTTYVVSVLNGAPQFCYSITSYRTNAEVSRGAAVGSDRTAGTEINEMTTS